METQKNLKESAEQRFSLREFLNYINPKAQEYLELIKAESARAAEVKERSGLEQPTDKYSEQWLDKILWKVHKALLKFVQEKISQELLIDLGGGRQATMKWLAEEFKAKTYIDVEKYLGDEFPLDPAANVTEQLGQSPKEKETEIVLVKADMLDFVSRVPDNSTNFVINGIDTFVIASSKYHSALAREISRATKIGGVVFGINTNALYELPEDRFRDVAAEQKVYREDIKVFEKIK